MKNLGTIRIETERLILRKFQMSDAQNMYKNWASDDEVTRYLTWPTHRDLEITKEVIKRFIDQEKDISNYHWCIELKAINEAVGTISVVELNEVIQSAQIGYCIGKKFWNKGIATEALKTVINFLFDKVKVNRVYAVHDINNTASGIVMKKSGLKYEGMHPMAGINNSGICDICTYGIIRQKYLNNKTSKISKIKEITKDNREDVNRFIVDKWYTTEMAVEGKLYDMSNMNGFVSYDDKSQITGLVTYISTGNEYEIMSLDSIFENKGIGTKLVNEVIEKAKENKMKKVRLITTNDNINAIKFYQKRGFDFVKIYKNAVDVARDIKPEIPLYGDFDIPIKHEIEFEMKL